ncbi:hypothetical protein PS15p_208273 [Mucor circinelloides]
MFQQLFADQLVKSHFYAIQRRELLASKKLLRVREEASFIEDQIANYDTDEAGFQANTEVGSEVNDEASTQVNDEASTQDCSEENFTGSFKLKFAHTFCQMQSQDKWYLSNGKGVEDERYAFGMQ